METGRFWSAIVALTICVASTISVFAYLSYRFTGIPVDTIKLGRCSPSSCGIIDNISPPFRLVDDRKNCLLWRYELYCENNVTVLHLHSAKYYVQEINYENQTIRLLDPGFEKNNCASIPRYSLAYSNFTYDNWWSFRVSSTSTPIIYLKCANRVSSSLYLETASCINHNGGSTSNSNTTLSQPKRSYSYVKVGSMAASDLEDGCSVERMALIGPLYGNDQNLSYQHLHNAHASDGFELLFSTYLFSTYIIRLFYVAQDLIRNLLVSIVLYTLGKFILGAPFVTALLIYKWRRRHLSMYSTIEEFLQSANNFAPIRYAYPDIKKMSNGFKEKLGEGGYGSVFKAKLRSGRFVAIKMLGKSKSDGQDFISEVATIGRIHHVNVVQLVGYCAEGSKRALVYDFMPNGSLDKYIYPKQAGSNVNIPLISCQKMYEIALGVARGIEYLHQGCEMQILHFDIKPHNILLDDNFIPKISDFGLAKLYPTDNSIVSLTAARGTMGYMAPELFYKNIGGVSFKADVYSFGMLLMEMASRRKNLNALAEHSSQLYFPSWVYDQYSGGKELQQTDDVTEEEAHIIKKMVISALWCIQLKPSDRPSMKKVIEMLEGGAELLQMPPKPSLTPQAIPVVDVHPILSKAELTSSLSGR